MSFALGSELFPAVLVEEHGVSCLWWARYQPSAGCFLDGVHEHRDCLHEVMGSGEVIFPFPMFSKVCPEFAFPIFKFIFVNDELVTGVGVLSLVKCGRPGDREVV